MNPDDPLLMAYADGELEGEVRARVEAAIAADPRLAGVVADHRALRGRLQAALAPVLDEPVPARLRHAAAGGKVVALDPGARKPDADPKAPGRVLPMSGWAVAAALVLGLAIGVMMPKAGGDTPLVRGAQGQWIAAGALSDALQSKLAGDEPGPVGIGLSFRDADGQWCRSFTLSGASSSAGLACRDAGAWRIVALAEAEAAGGELARAGTALPPAVLAAIDARVQGETLDADQERAARDAGWR